MGDKSQKDKDKMKKQSDQQHPKPNMPQQKGQQPNQPNFGEEHTGNHDHSHGNKPKQQDKFKKAS